MYYVSVPCETLKSGHSVTAFYREEDAKERLASEPGAEMVDEETALKHAGGNVEEITQHYVGTVHVSEPEVTLTVSGAWYAESLPGKIIAEMEDGSLISFPIEPYQKIYLEDADVYDGLHPRKLHGVPVPSVLYPYYGMEKSNETLSEVMRVRLSPSELEKVQAASGDKSVSEFIREWVRSL